VKENLKILTPFESDKIEAQQLLFSLDYLWQGKFNDPKIGATFFDCLFAEGAYLTHGVSEGGYFNNHVYKEITLPELRELARPKEYLNDKFELVVTNQPDDGWILVPDGADKYTYGRKYGLTIWEYSFWIDDVQSESNGSSTPNGSMYSDYVSCGLLHKILWQRENKVEKVKGREGNAGRFLHQEWYEAFGRGGDVQFKLTNHSDNQWKTLSTHSTFEKFNENQYEFRLKPQTIQIGSRTIVKPISVKPEMGAEYFVIDLNDKIKYDTHEWTDHDVDNLFLERGLIHLTKDDAINHAESLLELMK